MADQATGSLVIAIVDDVPTAMADTDAWRPVAAVPGNVITAVGTTSCGSRGPWGRRRHCRRRYRGLRGPRPSPPASTPRSPATYGTLSMQANGDYPYIRSAGTPGGVTDTFSYTLKDGDSDTSVTTLTISIGDQTPTVTVPVAGQSPRSTKPVCRPAQSAGSRSWPAATRSPRRRRRAAPSITSRVMARLPSPSASAQPRLTRHRPQTWRKSIGAFGTLTITGFTHSTVSYCYTLTNNTSGNATRRPSRSSLPTRTVTPRAGQPRHHHRRRRPHRQGRYRRYRRRWQQRHGNVITRPARPVAAPIPLGPTAPLSPA